MRRIVVAVVMGLIALVLPITPAEAKSPHTVDPLAMTPALNPQFDPWACWEAGTGITCQGELDESYQNEPIDFSCDGQQVYISGYGHQQMTRWHTADGLALKTIVELSYPADRFSLSPVGDGPYVSVAGHWQRHYIYNVPGDLSQRVLREIGQIYLVRARGLGKLLQDTGWVQYAPGQDFDVIESARGVHQVIGHDEQFVQAVCDALT